MHYSIQPSKFTPIVKWEIRCDDLHTLWWLIINRIILLILYIGEKLEQIAPPKVNFTRRIFSKVGILASLINLYIVWSKDISQWLQPVSEFTLILII